MADLYRTKTSIVVSGYYMTCQLLIIATVIANSFNEFVANYMLIVACGIIDLAHVIIKTYNNEILNKLDGVILHLIIFVTALPLFDDFDSPLVITIVFVLIILPLLNFIAVIFFVHKDNLKKIITYFKFRGESSNSSNDINNNEVPMKEFDIIVDDTVRVNVTVCEM